MNEIIPVESAELLENAKEVAESIKEVIPTTEVEYAELCEVTKSLRDLRNNIEDERKRVKQPYIDRGKEVDAEFAPVKNIVETAYTQCNNGCSVWETKRDEVKRKQQEELNRKAQEEQKRIMDEAKRLHQEGNEEEAARKVQEANLTVPPIIMAPTKKKGRTTRVSWKGEVTNPDKFVAWCIKNNKLEYLMPNEKAWDAYASIIKKPFTVLGVCRVYKKETRY